MPLYLHICKYFKFPIGRPVILVGDDFLDMEALLQKKRLNEVSNSAA
jgi:hypothetical protein